MAVQFYYEKSYDPGTLFGTSSTNGALLSQQLINSDGSGSLLTFARSFGFPFKSAKRAVPTVSICAPNGTSNQVLVTGRHQNSTVIIANTVFSTFFAQSTIGQGSVTYIQNNASSMTAPISSAYNYPTDEAYITYHYAANALLGT